MPLQLSDNRQAVELFSLLCLFPKIPHDVEQDTHRPTFSYVPNPQEKDLHRSNVHQLTTQNQVSHYLMKLLLYLSRHREKHHVSQLPLNAHERDGLLQDVCLLAEPPSDLRLEEKH